MGFPKDHEMGPSMASQGLGLGFLGPSEPTLSGSSSVGPFMQCIPSLEKEMEDHKEAADARSSEGEGAR